ncbi:MAG: tetratricopeptide repeat protein, partial [Polyangia bacterium]
MIAAVLTIVLLAAPSEAVSRAHFAKAQKAFAQHDWKRALDEFAATSEATPTELPDLWFDIGQCHRNLGHARQAVAAFERYLALKPDAADRDKVRTLIVALGGHVSDDPPTAPAPLLAAAAA